jgi:DNA-binding response OmpR family regulator
MPRSIALATRRILLTAAPSPIFMSPMRAILVVEDDDDLRRDICAALTDEGFVAREAQNGLDALLVLQEDQLPDLIILDLIMPTMNGWAFRAQQELDSRLAHIPVIVMSAAPLNRIAIVASDLVRKPVDLVELLARVRAHFLASELSGAELPNGVISAPLDIDDSPPLQ